jgi:tetratricopeptide (TPR) repeat protein
MFQAINLIKQPTFRFFLLFVLCSVSIPAEPDVPQKTCSLAKDGASPAYFLSRAYQEQREGFHDADQRKVEEAKKHHETSVQFFEKFHECQKEMGLAPTYLSAMSLSTSYMELGNLDAALKWSDTAYQMYQKPNIPPREIIILKSRILLRKGDLDAASKTLDLNLKDYPFDLDFLYYLGNIHYDLKQWNKSILYFISLADVIQKRDTGSKLKPTIFKFLGDLNYRLDYSRKSVLHYENYLQFSSNDADVQFRIAQIYFTLGEFAKSKDYLMKMRAANPREIDASHMLGEIYFIDSRIFAPLYFSTLESEKKIPKEGIIRLIWQFLKNDVETLESDLNAYISKNPNRLSARILLADLISSKDVNKKYKATLEAGQWAFQYRQYLTAENYFSKALAISKTSAEMQNDVPLLYEKISQCKELQSQIISAILTMRNGIQFAKIDETREALLFRLAYLLMNDSIKKYTESIKISDQLLSSNPQSANYNYLKGLLLIQKEDYKNAVLYLKKATELDQKNSNYLFYLAVAYDKLGDFPNTEKSLNSALEMSPEASNSYNYLGYLYAEKAINVERSEALLLKATDLEPDNAAYQDSIGWVYFRQGRLPEALLHLHFAEQISMERDLEDPVIFDHLGDVYHKKSDLVKADFYYQRSIALSKDEKEKSKIKQKQALVQKELSK